MWGKRNQLNHFLGKRQQTQAEIQAVFSPCADDQTIWGRLSSNMPGVDLGKVIPTNTGTCSSNQYTYQFYMSYNDTAAGNNASNFFAFFEKNISHVLFLIS